MKFSVSYNFKGLNLFGLVITTKKMLQEGKIIIYKRDDEE